MIKFLRKLFKKEKIKKVTIEDININANVSEVGFNRSFGVMVNYLYELKNIEKNHEDYINNKKVIISDKLKKFI